MAATSIEWCDHSINPIRARDKATGAVGHYCEKIAAGCLNCYSSKMQQRFKMPSFGGGQKRNAVELFLDESKLDEVRRRKKPTRYFWCDMTDIFGDWMKPEWLAACFQAMDDTPQHTHLLLTKRPENIARMWPWRSHCSWGGMVGDPRNSERRSSAMAKRPNVWLLTSVSDQTTADDMIPELLKCRDLSPVLGVSAEPLLGPVGLQDLSPRGAACAYFPDIDWLIVGGESGPNARPCNIEWIRSLRDQCKEAEVACFIKQLGAVPMHRVGDDPGMDGMFRLKLRDSKGGDWSEWEEDLRVREFPQVSPQ